LTWFSTRVSGFRSGFAFVVADAEKPAPASDTTMVAATAHGSSARLEMRTSIKTSTLVGDTDPV
jgi:hypothetical protein